ncbi:MULTISPECIES: hypothetical protein [unclassified Sphingomonas]|jgi:hypothetical protein|uniref:hypothetical protein n=1 Tax=Sphingomonas TaxID=13687 RepID=UPI000963F6FF|nr:MULTISPECIES: hypothetical protein [unclassified Sphingomonas]MBN8810973.1 hypothetical protein [Sphingomonas sp.]OJY54479.1 MAG: hypothetical protein BGP17_05405 [Sphingomonas sp. 67-41]
MIREALIGCALLGGGYYAMSTYRNADIVRTVNATPHDTWRGFDLALNGAKHGWTGHGPQGDGPDVSPGEGLSWPKVTSVDSKEIDYRVSHGGTEFLHMKLQFAPLDDGRKTRLSFNADFKGRAAIADYNPKMREAMARILDELIVQVETGKVASAAERFLDLDRQMRARPGYAEAQREGEQMRQHEAQAAAAKPMVDPDKGRLDPRGAEVTPRNPGSHY